jgi:hypothetical protein
MSRHNSAEILHLYILLNTDSFTKVDARGPIQPTATCGWLYFDCFVSHTGRGLVLQYHRRTPSEVDGCMIFRSTALLQSSATGISGDTTAQRSARAKDVVMSRHIPCVHKPFVVWCAYYDKSANIAEYSLAKFHDAESIADAVVV